MSAPLLELVNASVMRGDALVLENLTLAIAEGEHTAILGANGSGKSTLVQLLSRHLYPLAGGEVRVFGQSRWSVSELRSLIGIVSPALQGDFTSNEPLRVFEAVASGFFAARGLWQIHSLTEEMRERTVEALERVGAEHLAGRAMATLSTGEARRVLIARALVHRPKALLLDEPCTGLDPVSRAGFLRRLRDLACGGTTILMVTHHVEEILPEIETVVLLRSGRLIGKGPKESLLTSEKLGSLFGAAMEVERQGANYHARALGPEQS
ncbi:MAG TPA: ATP-binding cassette domain-containing protein [Sphingomicrobium sp.]|jgi:iron complex transport system ATP-binding protein|nr:ATP-binding cassette domain-containing protein [Sphingomicrobium sp.]